MANDSIRVRVPDLVAKKNAGRKITMLTAYDASMAHVLDQAGIDVLLVGDSLGMVIMGADTTIPVTLDIMVHHSRAVAAGTRRALVVADMPFLTYQASAADTVRNAGRLMQEGNVAAVKLEGGVVIAESVARLVEIGIPVMGHIGLTPQSVHQLGGYRSMGRTASEAERLLADAVALERAGAFAVVLECIPAAAGDITAELKIPTIGIGSGPRCDGQVLVSYDAFGLYHGRTPRFVRQYAKLGALMLEAAKKYVADVEQGCFPPANKDS